MRDLYLENEEDWKNPAEILEWLGFFHGAGLVHWSLVKGVSEATAEGELREFSLDAFSFHDGMLELVSQELHRIGRERSRE
jgi:hypothetical protein